MENYVLWHCITRKTENAIDMAERFNMILCVRSRIDTKTIKGDVTVGIRHQFSSLKNNTDFIALCQLGGACLNNEGVENLMANFESPL
jgi:hypothetical protein